jgi:hypothetical protein
VSVRLRNVSEGGLILGGRLVEKDEVVTVDGSHNKKHSPGDGHLIGGLVYPSALWSTEAVTDDEEK